MPKKINLEEPEMLTDFLSKLILKKKGENIKVLDLREITPVADFFIICTASSNVHSKAIADNLILESKKKDVKPWHNEGYSNLSWVLLDYVDVVVHIFLEETRRFYNLEGLWADAKITTIQD